MAKKFGVKAAKKAADWEIAFAIAELYVAKGCRGYVGVDRVVEAMGYDEMPRDYAWRQAARAELYRRVRELMDGIMHFLSLQAPELHRTLCERYAGRLPIHWGSRYALWNVYLPEPEKDKG